MNSNAIRQIRNKFIYSAAMTFFLVMFFMGVCINVLNIYSSHRQIRGVLDYALATEGHLVDTESTAHADENSPVTTEDGLGSLEENLPLMHNMGGLFFSSVEDFSPEFRYSTRCFTALFSPDGELLDLDMSNTAEVTLSEVRSAAIRTFKRGSKLGRSGFYYYKRKVQPDGNLLYAFVNCRTQIRMNVRILLITIIIGVFSLLLSFIIVFFLSGHFIRPEIENAKRQKQFITNASHELKTPLAVIRANTELEEMMYGESEWSQSTMRQVDRMSILVQNLVTIARAQEQEDRSIMQDINVSTVVDDSARPYKSLAQQEEKTLLINVTPGIHMMADESKIRQLSTLLIDNAFKYCDEKGAITISLSSIRRGRIIRLVVSNSFANGKGQNFNRYFERFYRADRSHNVDHGGYGIGLSIAESICQQYSGTINANWKDGVISFTCMLEA